MVLSVSLALHNTHSIKQAFSHLYSTPIISRCLSWIADTDTPRAYVHFKMSAPLLATHTAVIPHRVAPCSQKGTRVGGKGPQAAPTTVRSSFSTRRRKTIMRGRAIHVCAFLYRCLPSLTDSEKILISPSGFQPQEKTRTDWTVTSVTGRY